MGGSEVAIGEALIEDGLAQLLMQGEALGLAIVLVPSEIEPGEAVEDGVERCLGVALDVGIVDAQDHGAPLWRAYNQLKIKVRALPIWR